MTRHRQIAISLVVLLSTVAQVADAANLYRYRNSEGNLVIDYTVPPQFVSKGYEVLTESGRVIEVVSPQVADDIEPEEKRRRTEEELLRKKEDEMLLRTYSELSELESAMERRLQQLDREIEIIRSNLSKNDALFETSRTKAANYQFGGRAVPKSLLDNMNEQINERQDAENMLVVRQQEYETTKQRYLGYLDRFKELKAVNSEQRSAP